MDGEEPSAGEDDGRPPRVSPEAWSALRPERRESVLRLAAPLVLGGMAPDEAVERARMLDLHALLLARDPGGVVLRGLSEAWGEGDKGDEQPRSPALHVAWKACLDVSERCREDIGDGADPVRLALSHGLWAIPSGEDEAFCLRCGEDGASPARGFHVHPGSCAEDLRDRIGPAFRRLARARAAERG